MDGVRAVPNQGDVANGDASASTAPTKSESHGNTTQRKCIAWLWLGRSGGAPGIPAATEHARTPPMEWPTRMTGGAFGLCTAVYMASSCCSEVTRKLRWRDSSVPGKQSTPLLRVGDTVERSHCDAPSKADNSSWKSSAYQSKMVPTGEAACCFAVSDARERT
jgi:hypothetical protein